MRTYTVPSPLALPEINNLYNTLSTVIPDMTSIIYYGVLKAQNLNTDSGLNPRVFAMATLEHLNESAVSEMALITNIDKRLIREKIGLDLDRIIVTVAEWFKHNNAFRSIALLEQQQGYMLILADQEITPANLTLTVKQVIHANYPKSPEHHHLDR